MKRNCDNFRTKRACPGEQVIVKKKTKKARMNFQVGEEVARWRPFKGVEPGAPWTKTNVVGHHIRFVSPSLFDI